ncbi:Sigma factor regulator VreR (cytoplasmic membrane-localized) of trans-envelope signaling system [plant metagenome]|uniref:Sigma factor regulator VreR (Cytoplasmic membrane-localized) of trans-envelope signaling system n=2 Tax=plant metagenome TaxID=1297885 RepID=A0A484THZ9_9ZZZZ
MDDRMIASPAMETVLQREAQAWVVLLGSGRATARDGEAFQLWCRQSPAHARAFSAARAVWQDMQPAARAVVAERAEEAERVRGGWLAGLFGWNRDESRAMGRRAFLGAGMAACVGYLAVRPPLGLWPSLTDLRADYRTGTGEQREVMVADVQVRLNTQTRIAVAQGQGDAITLLGGEAEVQALDRGASQQPFCVNVAGGQVLAQAARFTVRHTGTRVSITCLEGEVTVARGGEPARTLAADEQLRYGEGGAAQVMRVDTNAVTAWRRRMLVFHKVPLAEVVEEINRYRSGRMVLMGDRLGRNLVQASFSLDRLDEAPALIRDVYGATLTELPGGVILLRQA